MYESVSKNTRQKRRISLFLRENLTGIHLFGHCSLYCNKNYFSGCYIASDFDQKSKTQVIGLIMFLLKSAIQFLFISEKTKSA